MWVSGSDLQLSGSVYKSFDDKLHISSGAVTACITDAVQENLVEDLTLVAASGGSHKTDVAAAVFTKPTNSGQVSLCTALEITTKKYSGAADI